MVVTGLSFMQHCQSPPAECTVLRAQAVCKNRHTVNSMVNILAATCSVNIYDSLTQKDVLTEIAVALLFHALLLANHCDGCNSVIANMSVLPSQTAMRSWLIPYLIGERINQQS